MTNPAMVPCDPINLAPNPGGWTSSFSVRAEPGRFVLLWDAYRPGMFSGLPDVVDYVIAVDRRQLYRSRGDKPGVLTTVELPPPGPDRLLLEIHADQGHFRLSPGRHLLTFGFVMGPSSGAEVNHVVYESSYWLDLPPEPPAQPQSPAPTLVPGKVLRGLFFLDPQQCYGHGLPAQAVHDAGVNTMTIGGMRDQWQVADSATFAAWRAGWDSAVVGDLQWCRDNGLFAMVEMDGLYRSAAERDWYDTSPARDDVVRHARDTFAAWRDVVVGMSMLDEVAWGPKGPIDVPGLIQVWRENPQAPPVCWPGPAPLAYETPDRADFAMRYQAGGVPGSSAKLDEGGAGWSLAQYAIQYLDLHQRLGGVPAGWPLGSLVVSMGGTYRKRAPGCYPCHFPSPTEADQVRDAGTRPHQMAAAVWLPLLCGARLLRGYFYDHWHARKNRGDYAPMPPGGWTQLGVVHGSDRWHALGAAFRSVRDREGLLCSRTPLPFEFDDGWAMGGVEGLRVAINCSPLARPNPHFGGGVLLTAAAESAHAGGDVPPGGVVLGT